MADQIENNEIEDIPPEESPSGVTNKKRLIKAIIILAVVLVLIPAVYFPAMYMVDYLKNKQGVEELKETVQKDPKAFGQIYMIKDLTVNTAGSRGRRFAVVEISLEIAGSKTFEEVKNREPEIRDALINYLRNYSDIEMSSLTFQKESKKDLVQLINERLYTGVIDSVYYNKLLIQ